jgi:hypothetical protein
VILVRSLPSVVIVTAAIFALVHIVVVSVPVLLSGGAGESQAFAATIFDLPISWLLGLFESGRRVLYGSSPLIYIVVFAVGGSVMYAALGALVGWVVHIINKGTFG